MEQVEVNFARGNDKHYVTDGWLSIDTSKEPYVLYLGNGRKAVAIGGPTTDVFVKTVNNIKPDDNGNVYIEIPEPEYPVTSVNGLFGDIKLSIDSEDESVKVVEKENGQWDLSILSPEIISYLKGLCEYKFVVNSKVVNATIKLDKGIATCTPENVSVEFSAGKYRGLDGTTASNPEAISIIDSSTTIEGWTKVNATKYTYKPEITDLVNTTVSIPNLYTTINVNETTEKLSGKASASVSVVKPWYLFTCETKPTAEIMNKVIMGEADVEMSGYDAKNNVAVTFNTKNEAYFYIAIPNTRTSCNFKQLGDSVMINSNGVPTVIATISTSYGNYKIYQSKSAQGKGLDITGNITIA